MHTGKGSMISEQEFLSAVYSIDIGQNDISLAFTANLTFPQVLDKIPSTLSRIRDSIEARDANRRMLISIHFSFDKSI